MSGKILARASAISLSILLAACGGDDSSSSLAGTGSEGDGGSGDGSSGGGEQTVSLELGTGSGSGFQSGQMNASATNGVLRQCERVVRNPATPSPDLATPPTGWF